MARMMVVFEVYVAPGSDPETLLSAETQRETKAKIMTPEQAQKAGFQGLPEPPPGQVMRLIAVGRADAKWVQRALEVNEAVGQFRMHEVG